jgi:hypothetical protein
MTGRCAMVAPRQLSSPGLTGEVRSPDAAKRNPGIVSSRPRISLRSIQATSEYVVALILRLGRDFARGIDTQPA